MGVYLYAGTTKRLTILDREGRETTAGVARFVCKAGDEDVSRWYGDPRLERTARLLKSRLDRADVAHGGINAPTIWIEREVAEGASLVLAKRQGTYADSTCEYVPGHLRQVKGRDGRKVWVVFPEPSCSYCHDTGIARNTGARAGAGGNDPGMRWNKGDECPMCGSSEAAMLAIANARRANENLARVEAEQRACAAEDAAARARRAADQRAAEAKAKLEAARVEYEAALNAAAVAGVAP